MFSDQNCIKIASCDVEGRNTSNDMDIDKNLAIKNKDKSPMCLVNELCRFNSITCRYELIEESGAPHSRTFSVLLKLGDKEEYQASAPSIRKAQHSAASIALALTKFPQPSPKSERKMNKGSSQLTPTVELNVLAMKRREPVQYHVYEQPVRPNYSSNIMPIDLDITNQLSSTNGSHELHDYRSLYHQRYHLVRGMMTPWYVATVVVGERQFIGKGKTIQIARHAAAEEALKTIRHLPIPNTTTSVSLVDAVLSDDEDSKSPVSMIYEAAMKRKLTVQFEVISESGPSHMPCFIVKCIVGSYSAEGKGVRKKTAKRRAAAAVLAELEQKEPINEESPLQQSAVLNSNDINPESTSSSSSKKGSTDRSKKRKSNSKMKKKKKDAEELNSCIDNLTNKLEKTCITSEADYINCPPNREIHKSNTSDVNNSTTDSNESKRFEDKLVKNSFSLNPISRLIQLQMAKKESEPKFKLIDEKDVEHRRKEFTFQCSITVPKNSRFIGGTIKDNELLTFGIGSNKKIAKKIAAEEMLKLLGYSSSSSSSSPPSSSKSFSPILKVNALSQRTESVQNGHHNLNSIQCANTNSDLNQVNSPLIKNSDNVKERRVKFMEESPSTVDESIFQRLENLKDISNQNSPKCGRQIAPGLLFVMSMNQTGYPVSLVDDHTVDES